MATYDPPLENLPVFDTSVFINGADGLSIAEADARYLRFPQSQGSETINGDLTITGTTTATTITSTGDLLLNPVGSVDMNGKTLNMTAGEIHNCPLIHSQNNNDIVIEGKGTGDVILKTGNTNRLTINDATGLATFADSVNVVGTLTAGTFAPAIIACDTLNATGSGATQTLGSNLTTGSLSIATGSSAINIGTGATTKTISIGASGFGTTTLAGGANTNIQGTNVNIGTNTTSGSISLGRGDATATSQTISIGTGSALTGAINIGTGAGTKTMGIGGTNTTLNLVGTAISASNLACNTFTTSTTATNASLFNEASRGGQINIGTGTNRSGTINIGTGGGGSLGDVQIMTNGGGNTNIGNASSTNNLVGTTNINTGGTATTQLGNNSASSNVNLFGTVRINDSGSQSTSIGNSTGTTTINGLSVFNYNIHIQQNDYTQPMGNTSQLGYTNSATTTTDPMSNTLTARSNFSLPSKGVWLIICGYEWSTNAGNTVEAKELILSTTSGGSTPAAYGLEYYEEINDGAGAAGLRQVGTITGVVSITTATTIYVNARSQISSGTNTIFTSNVSWTRIG